MPLHFGKIFGAIALLTVAAFVLWLLFTTFFATEIAPTRIRQRSILAGAIGDQPLAQILAVAAPLARDRRALGRRTRRHRGAGRHATRPVRS